MNAAVDLAHLILQVIATVTLLVPSLFLTGLALATLGPSARRAKGQHPWRLAILVAAHDEENSLGATLDAISAAADDQVAVHVVADNCVDATAAIAATAGACVHRRDDSSRKGKAAALNWLAARTLSEDLSAEAFVIVDADTHIEPGFFAALRERLSSGAQVVQAANLVRVSPAPLSRLRDLAFHLRCELRPRAFERLGVSAGLHGNGMCFRRTVLERYAWNERSVGEDVELHMRLVADGIRVRFAPVAVIRSTMPERFDGAAGQALRWERGKIDLVLAGVRLIVGGIVGRRLAPIVIGYDATIPPLSFLFAVSLGVALAGAAIGDAELAVIAAASVTGCVAYVARGLRLARVGPRSLVRMALWAIPYIAWKTMIVGQALAGAGRGSWAQARPVLTLVTPARGPEPDS